MTPIRTLLGALTAALLLALTACGSASQTAPPTPAPPVATPTATTTGPPSGSPTAVPTSTATSAGPVVVSADGTPAAFTNRTPLPSCGTVEGGLRAKQSDEAVACFTRAIGTPAGAELIDRGTTVEGGAIVEYYRSLPGSTDIEVFSDNTEDRFGSETWERRLCTGFNEKRREVTDCTEPVSFLLRPLVGTWVPVDIDDFTLPKPSERAVATITFNADGTWTGSDGCNGLSGTYEVDAVGTFSATAGPQTLIGCANVPNATVISTAVAVGTTADRLRFFGPWESILADYAPAP